MPAEHILSHQVNGTHWCVRRNRRSDNHRPTIVYLHGFTGSSEDFRPLISCIGDKANWIAVDFPGHGNSGHPDSSDAYSLPSVLEGIHEILKTSLDPGHVYLLGYSMGARIALHYIHSHKDCRGILISGSPGLRTQEERDKRISADSKWIDCLMDPNVSIEEFCSDWEKQEVIRSQLFLPEPLRGEILQRRRQNSKTGLASALRNLGTGALPGLWEFLGKSMGHLLVTGAEDLKFTAIARSMADIQPNYKHCTIAGSGHAPHLERSVETAEVILNYLSQCDANQSSS